MEHMNIDLILGLDNLKRHSMKIDLINNILHIKNSEVCVPFLNENEIKRVY